mmetsp:Transcript_8288/g.8586  ORF Transcript_8288/g.8586 Transcript_8288/m.8586 type:complete len:85 (+) Transcript_8288:584-838(+)
MKCFKNCHPERMTTLIDIIQEYCRSEKKEKTKVVTILEKIITKSERVFSLASKSTAVSEYSKKLTATMIDITKKAIDTRKEITI